MINKILQNFKSFGVFKIAFIATLLVGTLFPNINYANPPGTYQPLLLSTGIDCTGGTISHSGGFTIHSFTANGNFICSQTKTVSYFICGSGAGGGGDIGGAGAGGGVLQGSDTISPGTFAVVIGALAAGGPIDTNGTVGNTSSWNSHSAGGGGYGAGISQVGGAGQATNGNGGGGSRTMNGGALSGAGFAGGGPSGGVATASGGGGASASGGNGSSTVSGNGGLGLVPTNTLFPQVAYGSGGGGGSNFASTAGSGASGAGNGSTNDVVAQAGTANRCGGGGGGGQQTTGGVGGAGGSGAAFMSYPS